MSARPRPPGYAHLPFGYSGDLADRDRHLARSVMLARECATKLLDGRTGVTAERLDRFANRLLELAEAELQDAEREFDERVAAAAREALALATKEDSCAQAPAEPPGTR